MPELDCTTTYKEIPNHPGHRVGDDGSVWSCWLKVGLGTGRGTTRVLGSVWKRLKPWIQSNSGYRLVTLCPGAKKRYVHNLVLEAFVGPRPAGFVCRHFPDRDTSNNSASNVCWGTQKENAADRKLHGTNNWGERCGTAKITEEIVRLIRSKANGSWGDHTRIAKELGLSQGCVSGVISRRSWNHI